MKIWFAVGQKGGVSVYGLQRFPVTLYARQWLELLKEKDALVSFIRDHQNELSSIPGGKVSSEGPASAPRVLTEEEKAAVVVQLRAEGKL